MAKECWNLSCSIAFGPHSGLAVQCRYQHADGSKYEGQWRDDKQFDPQSGVQVISNPHPPLGRAEFPQARERHRDLAGRLRPRKIHLGFVCGAWLPPGARYQGDYVARFSVLV